MSATNYYLMRLKCGCEFKVAEHVVHGSDKHRCSVHGSTTLKFSRPWTDADNKWKPVSGDETGRLPASFPAERDPRLGEKRLTPREEARFLVDEVYKVREEMNEIAAEMAKLQAKAAGLAEEENRLVECLAQDHGLFYNPDR